MGIFKAYDIRGIYNKDLDDEIAYKIGRAFVIFLNCKKVVVGQDARSSSPNLFQSLTKGIIDQGADIVSVGLTSTPMFYFATKDSPAGIMVTASHNPKEYNGFKLCRENAIPISGADGIMDIEKLVKNNKFSNPNSKGKIINKDVFVDFKKHNLSFLRSKKPLKIVVDAANGMGAFTFPKMFKDLPFKFIPLYCDVDMSFPNHEANPLKLDTLRDLQKKVLEENADLGVALDGDADRCAFVDEKGQLVSNDLTTALVAGELLKKHPKSKILYDLRSSKATKEFIEENNGKPIMCRVGHAFIKKQMRDENAIFAGELSGHYYFKDSFFTESSFATTAIIINLISKKPLSELIVPLKRYFASGEINSEVKNKDTKLKQIEEHFKEAINVYHLDGLSIEFGDWWFNLRKSNTEPLLRLNLEANSQKLMEEKTKEVLDLVKK